MSDAWQGVAYSAVIDIAQQCGSVLAQAAAPEL